VRYDWLAHHLFETLDEIQDFATYWLGTYNHDWPNMALGGITPKQKLVMAVYPVLLARSKNGGLSSHAA
jgi:putative transposase